MKLLLVPDPADTYGAVLAAIDRLEAALGGEMAAELCTDGILLTSPPADDDALVEAVLANETARKARDTSRGPAKPEPAPKARPELADLTCPECGREFTRPQGLGRHRAEAHGIPGATRAKTTTKPALAVVPAPPTPKTDDDPRRSRAAAAVDFE